MMSYRRIWLKKFNLVYFWTVISSGYASYSQTVAGYDPELLGSIAGMFKPQTVA